MFEDILMKQVCFVDEKHRMDFVAAKLVDVSTDRVEDRRCGGRRRQIERKADVTVEVAASEGGVVTVGQSKPVFWKTMSQCAQDTGLADSRLSREQRMASFCTCLRQSVDGRLS